MSKRSRISKGKGHSTSSSKKSRNAVFTEVRTTEQLEQINATDSTSLPFYCWLSSPRVEIPEESKLSAHVHVINADQLSQAIEIARGMSNTRRWLFLDTRNMASEDLKKIISSAPNKQSRDVTTLVCDDKGKERMGVILVEDKLFNSLHLTSNDINVTIADIQRSADSSGDYKVNKSVTAPLIGRMDRLKLSLGISDGGVVDLISFRSAYYVLILFSFIAMSIISQSAAISGDEFKYIDQAEKVYNYFATGGADKAAITKEGIDPQHYNAQSFDNVLYMFQRWFDFEDQFKLRHLVNSWSGWLTIVVASAISLFLMGYRAAFLTLLFCLFSPRFLGHSMNNHRDIPFALAAVLMVYFAIKVYRRWPQYHMPSLLGLSFSIAFGYSLRFGGGVLLTGILCVSAFFYWLWIDARFKIFNKDKINQGFALLIAVIGVAAASFFIGLVNWPFGLEGPIKNTSEVMKATTNLGVAIRQLFEGENIMSNTIPSYYTAKYMFISIPAIILLCFPISFMALGNMSRRKKFFTSLVIFCFLFPLTYSYFTVKNDYGGWRHFLFTFPFLAILSSIGLTALSRRMKTQKAQLATIAVGCLLLAHPIVFSLQSHPNYYTYFNEFVGGIKGAKGYYETDYSLNSIKNGADWLIAHRDELPDTSRPLLIATNDSPSLSHYLRNYTDDFQVVYTRYYEKSGKDWDYGIYAMAYIDGKQIRGGLWPPTAGVVYEKMAGGVPIGVVVKRVSKEDFLGMEAMNSQNWAQAIQHFNKYLEINPNNEEVWVAKGRVELVQQKYEESEKSLQQALKLYPDYINAHDAHGRLRYYTNDFAGAVESFDKTTDYRKNYYMGYYFKALSYLQLKNYDAAIRESNTCLQYNTFGGCYDCAAQAYQAKGDPQNAQRYIDAKSKL